MDIDFLDLDKRLEGEVFSDELHLETYSTDESIFKVRPQGVIFPKSTEDLQEIVLWSKNNQVSITARAAGSSVAGQSIGEGLIIDFSKHLNQILDQSGSSLIVQPGVGLKQLNEHLEKQCLFFAPDPGSWKECSIGGMFNTNAAGPHHMKYGATREHINGFECILSDGSIYTQDTLKISQKELLYDLNNQSSLIHQQQKSVLKNSSGYAVLELLGNRPNFSRFWSGSEGTLGLTTKIDLKLRHLPKKRRLKAYRFKSWEHLFETYKEILETKPAALELLDDHLISMFCKHKLLCNFNIDIEPHDFMLWVEWEDSDVKCAVPNDVSVIYESEDPSKIHEMWTLRSRASKLLHQEAEKLNRKPLRCIEDCSLPQEHMLQFIQEVKIILKKHDCDGPIFGHMGSGHLHINPWIHMSTQKEVAQNIEKLIEDVSNLVQKLNGSLSGEHGDGLLRAPYLEKIWGPLMPLFNKVKNSFDPQNIFNPGKIIPVDGIVKFPDIKFLK